MSVLGATGICYCPHVVLLMELRNILEKTTPNLCACKNMWDFCIPNIVPVTLLWPVLMNASKNIILMENYIEEVHCYSSLQRSVLFLNPKLYNHVYWRKYVCFKVYGWFFPIGLVWYITWLICTFSIFHITFFEFLFSNFWWMRCFTNRAC